MLRALAIKYMPRIAIKGQVLADLVTEFKKGKEENKLLGLEVMVVFAFYPPLWEIYTDGVANHK